MKPERLRRAAADAVVEACNRVGRKAVVELLTDFGADKVTEVPDGSLEAFICAADELQPPPPSDDYLIGRAYCSTDIRYEMSMDERGKAIRDKLNECGLAIVRVEKRAPAQDPPPVPLSAAEFGTVVRLMGVGTVVRLMGVGKASGEYLVALDPSSRDHVLVGLGNGVIQRVYQDMLVQLIRSHV